MTPDRRAALELQKMVLERKLKASTDGQGKPLGGYAERVTAIQAKLDETNTELAQPDEEPEG